MIFSALFYTSLASMKDAIRRAVPAWFCSNRNLSISVGRPFTFLPCSNHKPSSTVTPVQAPKKLFKFLALPW